MRCKLVCGSCRLEWRHEGDPFVGLREHRAARHRDEDAGRAVDQVVDQGENPAPERVLIAGTIANADRIGGP